MGTNISSRKRAWSRGRPSTTVGRHEVAVREVALAQRPASGEHAAVAARLLDVALVGLAGPLVDHGPEEDAVAGSGRRS